MYNGGNLPLIWMIQQLLWSLDNPVVQQFLGNYSQQKLLLQYIIIITIIIIIIIICYKVQYLHFKEF